MDKTLVSTFYPMHNRNYAMICFENKNGFKRAYAYILVMY